MERIDAVRLPDDERMKRHAYDHAVLRALAIKLIEARLHHRRPLVGRIAANAHDADVVDLGRVGDRDKPAVANFDRDRLIIRHHVDGVFDAELRQQIEERFGRADGGREPAGDVLAAVPPYRFDAVADDLPDFVFGHAGDQPGVVDAVAEQLPLQPDALVDDLGHVVAHRGVQRYAGARHRTAPALPSRATRRRGCRSRAANSSERPDKDEATTAGPDRRADRARRTRCWGRPRMRRAHRWANEFSAVDERQIVVAAGFRQHP